MTGNTFIYFQNGERAHLVITISNIYIILLQFFFQPTNDFIEEIKKYIRVELPTSGYEEQDLNIVKLKKNELKDDTLGSDF